MASFLFQMVRTGLCNLVQKQPPNGLLTCGCKKPCSSSTMVQCTAHKLVLPKTLKAKLEKIDSAESCGMKDSNMVADAHAAMRSLDLVSIMHDACSVFFTIEWAQANPNMLLRFLICRSEDSMEMYPWHLAGSFDRCVSDSIATIVLTV